MVPSETAKKRTEASPRKSVSGSLDHVIGVRIPASQPNILNWLRPDESSSGLSFLQRNCNRGNSASTPSGPGRRFSNRSAVSSPCVVREEKGLPRSNARGPHNGPGVAARRDHRGDLATGLLPARPESPARDSGATA
jgi:hypothetical protein